MATAKGKSMHFTQAPDIVTCETHYVFVEKIGPFQSTAPQAWKDLHQLVPSISEHNKITGYMSLYKVGPKVYRAGVSLAAGPNDLPEGLQSTKIKGGKYSRFVLTGPYSDLPEACGRVFEIVAETKIGLRDDYCIENYVSDPRTTPEQQFNHRNTHSHGLTCKRQRWARRGQTIRREAMVTGHGVVSRQRCSDALGCEGLTVGGLSA